MRVANLIIRISLYVAMFTVTAMMLLTVTDVFMRYVFSAPIIGVTEVTEFMMVCLLLGMAACAIEGRHIKVDVVTSRTPPKITGLMDAIGLLLGIGLAAILVLQGYRHGLFQRSYGVASSMLDIPDFPFYIVLCVSFAILIIAMIVLFVKRIVELARP